MMMMIINDKYVVDNKLTEYNIKRKFMLQGAVWNKFFVFWNRLFYKQIKRT